VVVKSGWRHRSKNVALDAFPCGTVPISSEGGPAKWLKNTSNKIIIPTSNQEVGGSNPSGRTNAFLPENRMPRQSAGTNRLVRQLGRPLDKLDATAQGAAAVRSEAEDERRSREQSVRALQSNFIEGTE